MLSVLVLLQVALLGYGWLEVMAWGVKGSQFHYTNELSAEVESLMNAPVRLTPDLTNRERHDLHQQFVRAAIRASRGVTTSSFYSISGALILSAPVLILTLWPSRRPPPASPS